MTIQTKPILMSAPMVQATLREIEAPGTGKTQTRRIIKQATGPSLCVEMDEDSGCAELYWLSGDGPGYEVNETVKTVKCPYGKPGDLLYIKETFFAWGYWHFGRVPAKNREGWQFSDCTPMNFTDYRFSATETVAVPDKRQQCVDAWWKRPAIFMPRQASRLTLEITDVRVERLQDISEADAIAEGVLHDNDGWRDYMMPCTQCCATAYDSYQTLWTSINGPDSWDRNDWLWAVTFRPHLINVDQFIKARAA